MPGLPTKGVVPQSYGIGRLQAQQPHPLSITPQAQTGVFRSVYNKTLGGAMTPVPLIMARAYDMGRRNPVTTAFKTLMSYQPGTPQYNRALQAVTSSRGAYHPRALLRRADQFAPGWRRPENFSYWASMAASKPELAPWRAMGSASYMRNEARRRGRGPMSFIGGLPAYEWDRYLNAGNLGMQQLSSWAQEAARESRMPQEASPVSALMEFLQTGEGDLGSILRMFIQNTGAGDFFDLQ